MAEIFYWSVKILGWAFGAIAIFWLLGALLYGLPALIDPEAHSGDGAP